MNFVDFSFHPQVKAGITAAGYTNPTPIQVQAIPPVMQGRDVLGLAQTGTGKTAAFVLPLLQRLMNGPRGSVRALIVSPTRELAEQTHSSIQVLGRKTGLRSITVYGGVGAQPQIRGLRNGVEIVVACPGRLLDLMDQGAANLSRVEVVVLDEADQMFDMGFFPSIRKIMSAVPAKRQTLLFSATMPAEIRSLANDFLFQPVTVEVGDQRPVETVSHAIYPVDSERKQDMLQDLLSETGKGKVLVFTRTKHRAEKVAEKLRRSGMPATSMQGNLSQNRRQEAMDGFRSGRYRIMVATDIAARGIDVSQVSHVINFDMPDTPEAYTHRIGRTGRMENLGAALSLVTTEDAAMVRTIERFMGARLDRQLMEGYEISTDFLDQANPPRRATVQNQRPARSSNQRSEYPSRSTRPGFSSGRNR